MILLFKRMLTIRNTVLGKFAYVRFLK